MNSKLIMRLSMLGILSLALSFFSVFTPGVKAYCTVSVQCPNGPLISCSGDSCTAGTCNVSCKRDGDQPLASYCSGSCGDS